MKAVFLQAFIVFFVVSVCLSYDAQGKDEIQPLSALAVDYSRRARGVEIERYYRLVDDAQAVYKIFCVEAYSQILSVKLCRYFFVYLAVLAVSVEQDYILLDVYLYKRFLVKSVNQRYSVYCRFKYLLDCLREIGRAHV